ncbi:Fe-S cluster assembly iron-binding protein IscA [Desulfatibacillum alkenivorans DSM 16219]|uniref:Fe-S cluster assembly iron-binding protein IscA n=1 Tax=Desulfatibacillum alkenivorans DSM 16219 TaxID=1121393 RepID=A0A1M7ABI3_9BACT|nr:hypothetical protein [Desulfatibacillum alkenivorans]SHL40111.1 Fe-S cluster assembly iron-binding protein IscA [Desulfatibacillum alkenivorans DSM 16219]
MSYFQVDEGALKAMHEFLSDQGLAPWVRVEIQFTGCCDATLGLAADKAREGDFSEEHGGVTMVMDPEVYRTVGGVSVAHADEANRQGFVVKSERPLNEWAGFAPVGIVVR